MGDSLSDGSGALALRWSCIIIVFELCGSKKRKCCRVMDIELDCGDGASVCRR